ncbi:collagen triple helix repeat-containing protein 1-like [Xenia sp. Carnegie-2017]|uniref:collagen triple helix repeat-containing protein 1-like n=1 Tax=Xenia sp. Carnegie-2017 TaxID=2897299 RepID=UPI001F046A05|nr:collagen triple helix repeat-containing protein 1-like [Xenia sp. Carnegie-2017]
MAAHIFLFCLLFAAGSASNEVENGKLCVQGAQEDYIESNWKQCTWKKELNMNYGLIKSCSFFKKCNNTYLRVFYGGNLRISDCDYCCKRWYFKLNGKECSPTIEGVLYMWKGKGTQNIHRHRHIEGYCGNINNGTVNVGFYVGDCNKVNAGYANSGWNSVSRIVIQEVSPPQT